MRQLVDLIYRMPASPDIWLGFLSAYASRLEEESREEESPDNRTRLLHREAEEHLARAIDLGQHINQLETEISFHKQSLDLIRMPALLLDESSNVLQANLHALNLIANEAGVSLTDKTLRISDADDRRAFEETFANAQQEPGMHSFSITNSAQEILSFGITRLEGNHHDLYTVFVTASSTQLRYSDKTVASVLKLSRKEGEIAGLITAGRTLQQISKELGISYETVRTHLKNIYGKTGCQNQLALAHLVHSCCLPKGKNPTTGLPAATGKDGIIQLLDDRQLSYCSYGPEDGFPLLMHHSIEGSRKQCHYDLQVLYENNVRVIVVDRPGYGESTFYKNRKLHDWPGDLQQLVDHLNIEKFSLLGIQFGGEYAMVCAPFFQERAVSTHLVSVGPPPELEQSRDPFLFTRVATLLAKKAPGILQKTVQFASRKYANQPADFMRQIMIYKSESDLAYVNDTDLASHSYTAWLEGSRQTECLMAVEELRIRAEPWQIDFSAIECPVHIWHSRNDPQAPFARLETMLARIQDVRLHIIDDDSTMTWYHKWQDIIASVGKQSEAPV